MKRHGSTAGKRFPFPLVLVISLFFLWALTSNLIPVLIPHLKKACRLTDFQSAFIDSAYWIAYFVVALPAGLVMRKFGYKAGVVAGLVLASLGAFLFYPAADTRAFGFFLIALFIVAAGMTFLETAANPYITVLGPAESATQRLNFAQAFNGLGAVIATMLISRLILTGKDYDQTELSSMSTEAVNAWLAHEANTVKVPYAAIGLLLLLIATLFAATKFPEVRVEGGAGNYGSFLRVLRHPHLRWGVTAQFFYVGAQICVSSFFIRFAKTSAQMPELEAVNYLGGLLLGFMVGRYVGTFLMKYFAPGKLLVLYSMANILLLTWCVVEGGKMAVTAFIGVEFFMSIMYPTIFALSIKGLGAETSMASSFLVMAIIGGAIFPPIMGRLSDMYHSIQTAYVIPLSCFFVVMFFGLYGHRAKSPLATFEESPANVTGHMGLE